MILLVNGIIELDYRRANLTYITAVDGRSLGLACNCLSEKALVSVLGVMLTYIAQAGSHGGGDSLIPYLLE